MARPAAAAAALLMLAGLAALAAAESDRFSLPIMSKFDELDTDVLKVRMEQASVLWKTETASNGNCVVPTSPCSGNLLTSWFEAANAAERSWLTMAMIKDAYPKPGNLGVQGDGPDYECKMRGKWSALGADRVAFVNTELTNIVLMKAGRSVFVSYRGTWTDAQANNNRHEWGKVPLGEELPGQVHRGWLRSVKESWDQVLSVLADDFGCAGSCQFHLSGHSRGGGLASIAAALLPARLGEVKSLLTFGGVRPGNQEFQDAFNAKFGAGSLHWWNSVDWVPRQPFINYQPPRLRITEEACPAATTTDPCYSVLTTDRKGRSRTAEQCAKSQPNPAGDLAHKEWSYLKSMLRCAQPRGLDAACVSAL